MQDHRGRLGNVTLGIVVALLVSVRCVCAQTVSQSPVMEEGVPTLPPLGYLSFCERHADQCSSQRDFADAASTADPSFVAASSADHWAPAATADAASRSTWFNWRAVFQTQLSSSLAASDNPAPVDRRLSSALLAPTNRSSAMPRASDQFLQQLELVNSNVNSRVRSVPDIVHYGVDDYWELPLEAGGGAGDCEDYALEKRKMLMSLGVPMRALSIALVKTAWNEPHAVLLVRTDSGDYVLDNLASAIKPWQITQYTWIKWQSRENPDIWVRPVAR